MEEIALVALPCQAEDDSEEESTTANEESKESRVSMGPRSSQNPGVLTPPKRLPKLSILQDDEIKPRGYTGILSATPGAKALSDSKVYHNDSRGIHDDAFNGYDPCWVTSIPMPSTSEPKQRLYPPIGTPPIGHPFPTLESSPDSNRTTQPVFPQTPSSQLRTSTP